MLNIDLRSPKVFTPAILFAVLNSGILPILSRSVTKFGTALLFNALIFTVIYYITITLFTNIKGMTPADIIVPLVLFMILTPGVLLTIPPGSGGLFMSGQTSGSAVVVHSVVYAIVYAILRSKFAKYY